jgi:hypothetical protein
MRILPLFQGLVQLLMLWAGVSEAQNLKLFPGRYFSTSQRIYTDPDQAYRLRARYAEKNGPYGEYFIANVSRRNLSLTFHETSLSENCEI